MKSASTAEKIQYQSEEADMEKTIAQATVSDRFQTVIPQPVRERLKLVTGDKVEFAVSGDEVIIRKALSPSEKRKAWLAEALETYEPENLWGDLKDEPFRD